MISAAVRITDATSEPVTLAEAQAWLRVDSQDDASEITSLITTARQIVEDFTGQALLTQTWRLVASEWPAETFAGVGNVIRLPRSPLASVTSVKYYPEGGGAQATFASTNYHVVTVITPGAVVLADGASWPDLAVRPDAVEVNFTAGATTAAEISAGLKHAVLLVLAHLYELRSPVNVGNIVNELPFSLRHLLESHRVEGWVG
jgi:uncharacterized phiE125 gp8 family phage protein